MYGIKVVWSDGSEEFVKSGALPSGKTATFPSYARAKEQADFMEMGFDEDEYQSINVVKL